MRKVIFIFLAFWASTSLLSQDSKLVNDIKFYSDIVANADQFETKVRANDSLLLFVQKLVSEGKSEAISNLKWISTVHPDDGSFAIHSWGVQVSDSIHQYHAFLVKEDGSSYELNDNSVALKDDFEYMQGNSGNWFGQLYYNILPFDQKNGQAYILFGFNAWNQFESIKMADVLQFDKEGKPTFGKQVFMEEGEDERKAKQRIFLQYSDSSPVNLNYNPGLNMIIHDHLVSRMGTLPGQGPTSVSDGSYVGYELKKGNWMYVEKIYDHAYEEAPRPTPVLNKKEKDIFGKEKN